MIENMHEAINTFLTPILIAIRDPTKLNIIIIIVAGSNTSPDSVAEK